MIIYTTSRTEKDFWEIIELQKNNLPQSLSVNEMQSQGFVSVSHSQQDLLKMHTYEQNIIAKDNDKVVGYLLAMTKYSKKNISFLAPMFEIFENIQYKGKYVSEYNYLVVGQACIHKEYRGQSVLDRCYEAYKKQFKNKYDFAITEIATRNMRSVNAHKRIGFTEIHRYKDPENIEWSIVIWDWNDPTERV